MRYTFMHKEIPVMDVTIDDITGGIVAVGTIYQPTHIPVGLMAKGTGGVNRADLHKWWTSRAIPASRMGLQNVLETLNISTTAQLLSKAYGLSLSDQYWIKPLGSDLSWQEINFFDNPFSQDMGDILFGERKENQAISLASPDNTSDGWLKKKWKIKDGKRYLVKSGSGYQQEPYNEVIASSICRRLGIAHAAYTLEHQKEYPYCLCENFITPDTEFVTAYDLMQSEKKENHHSTYEHYIHVCRKNGIANIAEKVDEMLIVDYLMANEDRHQGNFGVIREANLLAYLGACPIFDTGNALWFDRPLPLVKNTTKLTAKPFKANWADQIKLVTSFSAFAPSKLQGLTEEITAIFADSIFIDKARVAAICSGLEERILQLEIIAQTHHREDNIQRDLQEDIRYSGKSTPHMEP